MTAGLGEALQPRLLVPNVGKPAVNIRIGVFARGAATRPQMEKKEVAKEKISRKASLRRAPNEMPWSKACFQKDVPHAPLRTQSSSRDKGIASVSTKRGLATRRQAVAFTRTNAPSLSMVEACAEKVTQRASIPTDYPYRP